MSTPHQFSTPSSSRRGFALGAFATVLAGALSLGTTAHAQMLLKPAAGSTIYESTEHGGGFSGSFAFDGTINAAGTGITSTGSTIGFAAKGDAGDHNPILAFNLSSTATVNGFGYAQFNGPNDTVDLVSSINVFSLTQAQYSTYTAGLVVSGNNGAGGTANKSAPAFGSFQQVASVTGLGAGGYTQFTFNNTNSTSLTGQYFVVQFVGNNPTSNPGAVEFELRAVPEPSAWTVSMAGLVLLGFVQYARRLRNA